MMNGNIEKNDIEALEILLGKLKNTKSRRRKTEVTKITNSKKTNSQKRPRRRSNSCSRFPKRRKSFQTPYSSRRYPMYVPKRRIRSFTPNRIKNMKYLRIENTSINRNKSNFLEDWISEEYKKKVIPSNIDQDPTKMYVALLDLKKTNVELHDQLKIMKTKNQKLSTEMRKKMSLLNNGNRKLLDPHEEKKMKKIQFLEKIENLEININMKNKEISQLKKDMRYTRIKTLEKRTLRLRKYVNEMKLRKEEFSRQKKVLDYYQKRCQKMIRERFNTMRTPDESEKISSSSNENESPGGGGEDKRKRSSCTIQELRNMLFERGREVEDLKSMNASLLNQRKFLEKEKERISLEFVKLKVLAGQRKHMEDKKSSRSEHNVEVVPSVVDSGNDDKINEESEKKMKKFSTLINVLKDELQKEKNVRKDERRKFEEEKRSFRTSITEITNQLKSKEIEMVMMMEKKNNEKSQIIDDKTSVIENLNYEIGELGRNVSNADEVCRRLSHEKLELENMRNEDIIKKKKLEQSISRFERIQSQDNNKLNELKKYISSLEQQQQNMKSEHFDSLKHKQTEKTKVQNTVEKLRSEIETKMFEIEEKERNISEYHQKLEKKEKESSKNREIFAKTNIEKTNLSHRLTKQNTLLEQKEIKIKQYQSRTKELQELVTKLEEQISIEKQRCVDEKTKLEGVIHGLETQVHESEELLTSRQHKLKNLQKKLNEAHEKIKDFDNISNKEELFFEEKAVQVNSYIQSNRSKSRNNKEEENEGESDVDVDDDSEEEEEEDFKFLTDSVYFDNPSNLFPVSPTPKAENDQRMVNFGFGDRIAVATKNFRKSEKIYPKIDQWITSLSSQQKPDKVEELVKLILSSTDIIWTEECKVRAIFVWIVMNVRYKETDRPYTADKAYSTGLTICGGFAKLFWKMSELMEIECQEVDGFTKSSSSIPGQVYHGTTNHAWNIVAIDGRWFYIDCSHASCLSVKEEDALEFDELDEFYFLTNPEHLIFNHWRFKDLQFIQNPISREAWEKLVFIGKIGFEKNLSKLSQKNAVVVLENGNNWKFTFEMEQGNSFQVDLWEKYYKKEENLYILDPILCPAYYEFSQDGKASIYISFPKGKAIYKVRIGISNSDEKIECALVYQVEVKNEVERVFLYPTKTMGVSTKRNCQILNEGCREITSGKENLLRLRLPGCKGGSVRMVYLENGSERRAVQFTLRKTFSDRNVFECKFVAKEFIEVVTVSGKWDEKDPFIQVLYEFRKFVSV